MTLSRAISDADIGQVGEAAATSVVVSESRDRCGTEVVLCRRCGLLALQRPNRSMHWPMSKAGAIRLRRGRHRSAARRRRRQGLRAGGISNMLFMRDS